MIRETLKHSRRIVAIIERVLVRVATVLIRTDTEAIFVRDCSQLELLAFIDLHEPQIVAIQETKIDSSISSSELFPETFPYSVYRKDRTLDGGGVMLLIHKDIPHMPITELENKVKVFANKTAHFVASWYRPPHSDENLTPLEDLQKFDTLFREPLNKIRDKQRK